MAEGGAATLQALRLIGRHSENRYHIRQDTLLWRSDCEKSPDHRHYRTRWILSRRVSLAKGYEVYGIIRRSSSFNTGRIDPIYVDPHVPNARLKLIYGDLNDASSLNHIIRTIQPDEIYNLGAQSHVRVSFDIPEYTADVTGLGAIRLLEAIRESGLTPKFYQASSSEMYGKVLEVPQRETTPFYPRSPYGAAKVYAY